MHISAAQQKVLPAVCVCMMMGSIGLWGLLQSSHSPGLPADKCCQCRHRLRWSPSVGLQTRASGKQRQLWSFRMRTGCTATTKRSRLVCSALMSPHPVAVCNQTAGLYCSLAVSVQFLSAPMWSTGQETVVSYKPAMAQHHPEMDCTRQTAAAAAGSN